MQKWILDFNLFDGVVKQMTAVTKGHWKRRLQQLTCGTNLDRQTKKSRAYLESINKHMSLKEIQKVNRECINFLTNISYEDVDKWGVEKVNKYVARLITLAHTYCGKKNNNKKEKKEKREH